MPMPTPSNPIATAAAIGDRSDYDRQTTTTAYAPAILVEIGESLGDVRAVTDTVVVVDNETGTIVEVRPRRPSDDDDDAVVTLPAGHALAPGFIDCHAHAPQYSYTGTATHLELMRWLDEVTFPAEAALKDVDAARRLYETLVRRLLRLGTTTACYFGTIHEDATVALAEICATKGQRALVGKVSMDRLGPADYCEASADVAIAAARSAAVRIRALGSSLVEPIVTPRFVPTCTPALLRGLARLAEEMGMPVQSHIAESDGEVALCERMEGSRDPALLDAAGLLTSRAIMAHAVKLNASEVALLASQGTAIASCPLSNAHFADGTLMLRQAHRAGVKVGLGTDIAGGVSPSMLASARQSVVSSRAAVHEAARAIKGQGRPWDEANQAAEAAHALNWRDGWWLGTAGGARALGLDEVTGRLAPGRQFDALLVDMTGASTDAYDAFDGESDVERMEKWFNLGDDREIRRVWVGGRVVCDKGLGSHA